MFSDMPAQIFISCGQANERERATAAHLKAALITDGYRVHVAIQAQSLNDINAGIIRELERSDYYIFIDLGRERLSWKPGSRARGSLFTHQELAIAHRSNFERALFFQQEGVELEGLLRYMGANATSFRRGADLVALVRRAMSNRDWRPDYSRHLIATRPRWESFLIRTPRLAGRFFFVDIENRRRDVAAYDTVARLEFIRPENGERMPSPDRSHLKVTGQPGFSQVIWPSSHGAFNVLMVGAEPPHSVYLDNALDVAVVPELIKQPGRYELEYAVLAKDLPVLHFTVDVELTGDLHTTDAKLRHD
jgi:hypothetical protein